MDKNAASKMQALQSKFKKTGLFMGVLSGLTYGIYSTLVVVAGQKEPLLSAAALVMAVTFVTCGLNDLIAGLWLLIYNAKNGKLAELGRSVNTFPGKMVIIGALLGGPLANGAYLLGLSMAGASAIPISATCALFGALFGWLFLKQKPDFRVVVGMIICVAGAVIINLVKPEGVTNFTLGIICAFVAAISWGLEGVVSSFGGAILDCDIAWYKANSTVGCAIGMSLNVTYAFWGVVLSVLFLGTSLTPTMLIGSIVIVLGAITVTMNPLDFLKKGE